MANIIKQKTFAERAGVSTATVCKAAARGKRLAPACVMQKDDRKRKVKMIDADHPAAIKYVADQANRRLMTGAPVTIPPKPAPMPTQSNRPGRPPRMALPPHPAGYSELPDFDPNQDIREYMEWPLSRIVATFGTGERFLEWLRATKILVEIHAKNLQTLNVEEKTISRDLVRLHIFGAMNDSNQRLLIDAPKTIARRISAHAKSDGTIEDAEKMVRDIISKQLRNATSTAQRLLETQSEANGGGNL